MPYIEESAKDKFNTEALISDINKNGITPGELNYLITTLVSHYIDYKGVNYTHLNDVIGVLESAKQEFYRRIVTPYESGKLLDNGDVYSKITLGFGKKQ